jgi:hypothetical protein
VVRQLARLVTIERSTTPVRPPGELSPKPVWKADLAPVSCYLMPPGAQLEQTAALRDETISQVGRFSKGVTLSTGTTRVISGSKAYTVGRVTETPREVVAELREV